MGIACGLVFVGLMGCESACSWDITGPACVRACRLMMYAVAHGLQCVTDDTVRDTLTNVSQLCAIGSEGIVLKGVPEPVRVCPLPSPCAKRCPEPVPCVSWECSVAAPQACGAQEPGGPHMGRPPTWASAMEAGRRWAVGRVWSSTKRHMGRR